MFVSLCARAFLAPSSSNSLWLIGDPGSGYSGVDGARRAVGREYPSISAFILADDRHFLIIVPIDFRFLSDFIRCLSTFEFKSIVS